MDKPISLKGMPKSIKVEAVRIVDCFVKINNIMQSMKKCSLQKHTEIKRQTELDTRLRELEALEISYYNEISRCVTNRKISREEFNELNKLDTEDILCSRINPKTIFNNLS